MRHCDKKEVWNLAESLGLECEAIGDEEDESLLVYHIQDTLSIEICFDLDGHAYVEDEGTKAKDYNILKYLKGMCR